MARKNFNPKRRIRPLPIEKELLTALAKRVHYGGNPEHKMKARSEENSTGPESPRALGKRAVQGLFQPKETPESHQVFIVATLSSIERPAVFQLMWRP